MERLIIWLFHFLFFFFHYQSASSSPLSSSPSSTHSCPLDERSSLLQFRQIFTINSSASPYSWCDASGSFSYANTLSWNETTDCCSWDGVTCDVSTGHVTGLDLRCSKLYGRLPSRLFITMPSLERLDLSSNELTGPIPEFGGDSSLEFIDFSYNKLHGPIPQSISGLVNLRYLDLQRNNLNGFLELQKFSNLKAVMLSGNISVSIGSNANATLPSLGSLSLSSCNITDFPHFLQNTSENLKELDLSNNKIHGEIPKWVEGAPLSLLDLSHNYLYGEIPSSICNLSSLHLLGLSNNNFTGVIPPCLGNVSLLFLDLRMNGFHGAIPATFANGSKLMSVNLYGNHLQGPIPRSLANCKNLRVLDLGNNNLSGSFPHWLESLPELQVLVLKSNRFHGPIGTSGSGTLFPMLRIFDLSHNNFTGLLPLLNFKAMMNVNKSKIGSPYMGTGVYEDSVDLVLKGVDTELERIHKFFTI